MATINLTSTTGSGFLESDFDQVKSLIDGEDTAKLSGIETGADVTDTTNVTAAGALMDSEVDVDIKTLSLPANTTISTFGKSLIDDAAASNARSTLDVDQAGTDNSTDVTLSGTPDYITISGQVITRNAIDLAADITGNLPVANLNSGTGASGTSFWRGDGTWATPAGSGNVSTSGSPLDNDFAKFVNGTDIEGRSYSEVLSDLSLDSELQNLSTAEINYLEAIYATGVTSTEYDYLDGVTSNIQTQLNSKGTGDGTVDTSGSPIDNDYAKFTDGNTIEGRSYSEMRTDLNVANGATANSSDATLLARANHTGTQTMSTISDAGDLATQDTVNNTDWSGTDLSVANGGTGASTLTSGNILRGNGTSAITSTLGLQTTITDTDTSVPSSGAVVDYAVERDGVQKISVGTSTPSSPSTGDLWVDTN